MRWLCAAITLMLTLAPVARAQDAVQPDQLRKMIDDAMDQLKAAQERKNQLAAENDQLKARAAELQKQLDAAQSQLQELQRQAAGYAEKTFYFRSYYVAWQEFLRRYPTLAARWKIFLENDHLTSPRELPDFSDPDWPMDAYIHLPVSSPVAPASQPSGATTPATAPHPATTSQTSATSSVAPTSQPAPASQPACTSRPTTTSQPLPPS